MGQIIVIVLCILYLNGWFFLVSCKDHMRENLHFSATSYHRFGEQDQMWQQKHTCPPNMVKLIVGGQMWEMNNSYSWETKMMTTLYKILLPIRVTCGVQI